MENWTMREFDDCVKFAQQYGFDLSGHEGQFGLPNKNIEFPKYDEVSESYFPDHSQSPFNPDAGSSFTVFVVCWLLGDIVRDEHSVSDWLKNRAQTRGRFLVDDPEISFAEVGGPQIVNVFKSRFFDCALRNKTVVFFEANLKPTKKIPQSVLDFVEKYDKENENV
jgi:hypothetical protein